MLTTIVIIIVIIAVLIVGSGAWMAWQRRALRNRFGPEYDRVADQHGSRLAADRELRARQRAHERLDLRPLPPEVRQRYEQRWRDIQALFVEDPTLAVTEADELVTAVLGELGYPTGEFDAQAVHLSVRHAGALEHYREAHEVYLLNREGDASTEQLRQSLVHYRILLDDLLAQDGTGAPASDAVAASAADSGPDSGPGSGPGSEADSGPDGAVDSTASDGAGAAAAGDTTAAGPATRDDLREPATSDNGTEPGSAPRSQPDGPQPATSRPDGGGTGDTPRTDATRINGSAVANPQNTPR